MGIMFVFYCSWVGGVQWRACYVIFYDLTEKDVTYDPSVEVKQYLALLFIDDPLLQVSRF